MRTLLLWLSLPACSGGAPDPEPLGADTASESSSTLVPIDPYATVTPSFAFADQDFEGRRLTTAIPDDLRGLLFVFHGTNGDIPAVTQTEWIVLYNLLVPQGVGLVLTAALDDQAAQWDLSPTPDNADYQLLSRIRDHLVATTEADADTPVLSIGFSHGAAFASVFANLAADDGWNVRGFAYHQGGTVGRLVVPGFFVSAENDEEGATGDRVAEQAETCSALVNEPCPHRVGHEIPLHPLRFARLTAYGDEQSRSIFDELVGMGLVDPDGARLVDLDEGGVDAIMEEYIRTSEAPSPSLPPTQLRVVWATHRFSAEHAVEEAGWLLDRLDAP
jgi:hypothetical protein